MKNSAKMLGYIITAGVMAMSPISAFATEGSGTNSLSFYDYLAEKADKDTVIDFNEAPATGNETIDTPYGTVPLSDVGGLYMLQSTKDDEKPMYFFRGNVEDNNVILNDFCWLMVRTTETGGTKLLYNGMPTEDGQCLGDPDWTMDDTVSAFSTTNNGTFTVWPTTNIGASKFNEQRTSPADLGYMFGERFEAKSKSFNGSTVFGNDVTYANGQYTLTDTASGGSSAMNAHHYTCLTTETTCAEVYYANYLSGTSLHYFLSFTGGDNLDTALAKMAKNTNESTMKIFLEDWYEKNMADATDFLEDTIWYGGKAFASGALSTKDSNFNSNYDKEGTSHTKESIDTYYHGASREHDSVLPLIRNNGSLPDFGLETIIDAQVESDGNEEETTDESHTNYLSYDDMVNGVSFDYSDPNGVYTVANGALNYPVGLLTGSEIIMAGNGYPAFAKGTYIDDNFTWWSLSPRYFFYDYARTSAFLGHRGFLQDYVVDTGHGVRPAVSLKSTLSALEGDGSKEHPFRELAEVEEKEDKDDDGQEDRVDGNPTSDEKEDEPINPQTIDPLLTAMLTLLLITPLGLGFARKLAMKGGR